MFPQSTPPSADTIPVMAQASPKYRSTLIPMAMATCWLSATARMATPLRDLRKNQPKPARKARLTAPPELDRRDEQRAPHEGLVAERQGERLGSRPDGERPEAAQNGRQADGGHDHRDHGTADELAEHDALESEAHADHAAQAEGDRQPQRRPGDTEDPDHHEAAIITNSPWAKFTASVAL
jgi:hypothetical protein